MTDLDRFLENEMDAAFEYRKFEAWKRQKAYEDSLNYRPIFNESAPSLNNGQGGLK